MNKSDENLKRAGLKATQPRIAIFNLLDNAKDRHMSVDEVHRQLIKSGADVGIATVYRVLTQFESAGLVIRHNFDNGYSIFELARDDHHDHLRCLTCGRIVEFFDQPIEDRQEEVANELGFNLRDHSLVLYGSCNKKDCEYRKSKHD